MRRGASKQLESKEAGGADPSQPFVYYFVWGLFMSLTIMATTVVSALVPWSLAKRVAHLAVLAPPQAQIIFVIPLFKELFISNLSSLLRRPSSSSSCSSFPSAL